MNSCPRLCLVLAGLALAGLMLAGLMLAGAAQAQGVNEHMIQGAPPYWNAEPYRPERSRAVPNRPAPPVAVPRLRRFHPHDRTHRR